MKKFFKNKFLYVLAGLCVLSPFATVPLCISALSGATAVTACAGMILGGWILGASIATIQYSINGVEKMKKDPNYGNVRFMSGEPVGYDDVQQLEAIRECKKKHKIKTEKKVEVELDNSNDDGLTL